MSIMDKPQTISIAIARGYHGLRTRLRTALTLLTGFSAFLPKHITIAPRDLNTADPLMAEEFYRGRYVLGGVLVETYGKSPFVIVDAPLSWKEKLHCFGWVRHLAAKEDNLSASHARSLISEWMEQGTGIDSDFTWRSDMTARRLINWLCHSDTILYNADHEFHMQFRRSLAAHVRYLKRHAPVISDSHTRALSYIALSYASVCHENQQHSLGFARERLGVELERQIFPDGGHASRNPSVIVDYLALLLPLRQACHAVGVSVPVGISSAIERMLPALRFFRMGDGSLARFNGSNALTNSIAPILLRYDETSGQPLLDASNSGYQRMIGGESTVVVDVGNPPRGELSVDAHAGCLSFEFSSGAECIVVNCGVLSVVKPGSSRFWRATAAHSTIVLCETSCCRFENNGGDGSKLTGQVLSAGMKTECERSDTEHGSAIVAAHTGYAREFGVRVVRSLTLEEAGRVLKGDDLLTAPDGTGLRYSTRDQTAIHFHLHPDVRVARDPEDDYACIIETRSRQRWRFACEEVIPEIEESIFFATSSGSPRGCFQIVLRYEASNAPGVNWMFKRVS